MSSFPWLAFPYILVVTLMGRAFSGIASLGSLYLFALSILSRTWIKDRHGVSLPLYFLTGHLLADCLFYAGFPLPVEHFLSDDIELQAYLFCHTLPWIPMGVLYFFKLHFQLKAEPFLWLMIALMGWTAFSLPLTHYKYYLIYRGVSLPTSLKEAAFTGKNQDILTAKCKFRQLQQKEKNKKNELRALITRFPETPYFFFQWIMEKIADKEILEESDLKRISTFVLKYPHYSLYRRILANASFQSKNRILARHHLKILYDQGKLFGVEKARLALSLESSKPGLSLSLVNEALSDTPHDKETLYYSARVLKRRGDHSEAALLFESIPGYSNNPQILRELCYLYQKIGQKRKEAFALGNILRSESLSPKQRLQYRDRLNELIQKDSSLSR